ncbi:AraC family transcriptional regulator [Staphylococcus ursi]|uniref:AraC family transcriptional regulator n=2 Tax=Staphylococcus TaxID=1279 RepID=UPI001397F73F|nr:AraC family transcriptional regulator [Staphylococcus sp. MI 10-1553]QHW36268.1 AraC family transcriptional regulator [Staphylococcus sp. MI 10-1553]
MGRNRVVSNERTNLFNDIHFLFAGEEYCDSGYQFGPAVRPNFIIHFIVSGKGYYQFDGQTYQLSQNQGFVIFPDKLTTYWADEEDPWHYVWIGFTGTKSHQYMTEVGVSLEYPIIKLTHMNQFQRLINTILNRQDEVMTHFYFQSVLNQVFHDMRVHRDDPLHQIENKKYSQYTHQVLHYIENHYTHPFTVTDMAKDLFVNRCYLSRVFKEETGMTLKDYMNHFRITRARDLLIITNYSYTDIAQQLGYESYNSFYKMFRKITGETPSVYRHGQHLESL